MGAPRRTSPDASDHDLLVRIDAKLEFLQTSLGETRTALSARIDGLGKEKANVTDLDPLRKAIERHQETLDEQCEDITKKIDRDDFKTLTEKVDSTRRLVWIGVGVLGVLEALSPLL